MKFEAFPMEYLAASDGVFKGVEHIILHLAYRGGAKDVLCVALSLEDAKALLRNLESLIPKAEAMQEKITESN